MRSPTSRSLSARHHRTIQNSPVSATSSAMKLLFLSIFLLADFSNAKIQGLKVHITTWNVNQRNAPNDVKPLLGLHRHPDIIAVGLQEVTFCPFQALCNAISDDSWTNKMEETLHDAGFFKIRTVAMVGIVLNVYAQAHHYLSIKVLDQDRVALGFNGLWGNKGGVSLTIVVYGRQVTFVAAHLAAGEGNVEERIENFQTIEKKRDPMMSLMEAYIFWMGDLNFRLDDPVTLTPRMIQDKALNGSYSELLEKDQLNQQRAKERVFKGYEEQPINFKPTYRYTVGSEHYDLDRRPAWTDRILYLTSSWIGDKITPLYYGVIPNFQMSDHLPVEAVFEFNVSI